MPQVFTDVPGEAGSLLFKFNGQFALKNYNVEIVNGNRLKVTSVENELFSLLEVDVTEVDINGMIYSDAQAAQIALQSLVFSDEIPVILTAAELAEIRAGYNGCVKKTTTTITAPDSTFKYAYIFDENNNVRRMLAGDLGKNVANSALTSVVGAGMTLGANWAINTSGFYYSITGLADVSNDSTFNTLLTQNSSGRVAKSNGKAAFTALPALLTEAEKTTWKIQMNGGWTTNTMSVTAVIPPVVEKDTVNASNNNNVNITLEGANLNLNPANFTISICTGTSTAGNVTILETINNSKVTLLNANYINFFLNVNNYQGDYKVLLFNGVASYLTDVFTISSIVNSINLSAITWSNKTLNNVTSPNMSLITNGFKSFPDANVAPVALSSQIVHKIKTVQPLFNAGDNFYLEIIVSITNYLGANSSFEAVGLSSNNIVNDLSNDLIVSSLYQFDGGANGRFIDYPSLFNYTGTQVFRIIFIKKGNVIIKRTYARLNNTDIVYQVQSSISPGLDLYFGGVVTSNDSVNKGLSSQIIKAYKF